MRCILCQRISWHTLCTPCLQSLGPQPEARTLACGLSVISLFPYDEIASLLHTKYEAIGSGIYRRLARHLLRPVAQNFTPDQKFYAVGIDEDVTKGYAHTAILSRSLRSGHIRPMYGKLLAENKLSYAGKSLAFRKANPRGFTYTGPIDREIILVDDLLTSGTTLCEAKAAVEAAGGSVALALVLAAAKLEA